MIASAMRRFKATSRKTTGAGRTTSRPDKDSPEAQNWREMANLRVGLQCTFDDDTDVGDVLLEERDIEDVASALNITYSKRPFVFQEPSPSANVDTLKDLSEMILKGNQYAVVWEDSNGTFSYVTDMHNPKYNENLLELLEDSETGRQNYVFKCNTKFRQTALYAKRDLEADMPIGVETGALWMEKRWQKMDSENPDQMVGLFVTDIPRTFLHNIAKKLKGRYKGDGLLYDSSSHGNELRFLQDPTWYCRSRSEPRANLGAFVVFTDQPPYVQLVYFTTTKIKAGEELTVHYGEETWEGIFNLQLAGNARLARGYHRRLNDIEEKLRQANRPIPNIPVRTKKNHQIVFFNTCEDKIFSIGQEGESSEAQAAFERLDPVEATLQKIQKRYSYPLKHVRQESLTDQFEEGTWPENIGRTETLIIPNSKRRFQFRLSRDDQVAWKLHPTQLHKISRGEDIDRYVNLVKIINPYHPVNLFAPPDQGSGRALVARRDIPENFPIAQYSGELVYYSDQHLDEVNGYTYELDDLESRGYRGPRLFVNAERIGGLARFINDIWTPTGYPKKKPNCYIRVVIDRKDLLPMAVVYTQKKINQGEELMIDYGTQYWKLMFRGMVGRLTDFILDTSARCEKLEKYYGDEQIANKQIRLKRIPGIRESEVVDSETEEEDGKPSAKETPGSARDSQVDVLNGDAAAVPTTPGKKTVNTRASGSASRVLTPSTMGKNGSTFTPSGPTTKPGAPSPARSQTTPRASVSKRPASAARIVVSAKTSTGAASPKRTAPKPKRTCAKSSTKRTAAKTVANGAKRYKRALPTRKAKTSSARAKDAADSDTTPPHHPEPLESD